MDIRLTGDIDRFRRRISDIANKLEQTVKEGMYASACAVRDQWINDATQFQLDDDYIMSIKVTQEPVDGYYVGPTKWFAVTPEGIKEEEELEEGDYISYMARCSIHKYYREVKRRTEPGELEQYDMPDVLLQRLDDYKNIIKQIISEKIQSLMRGE